MFVLVTFNQLLYFAKDLGMDIGCGQAHFG
jgi:hypothetical protein